MEKERVKCKCGFGEVVFERVGADLYSHELINSIAVNKKTIGMVIYKCKKCNSEITYSDYYMIEH